MNFQPLLWILSTSLISISYTFVSFYRGFAFLTGVYVKYLLQNRFAFFISLFGLSAILKIRNGEHAHYVGLVVAYTWNREKQMFVALGKEFDMCPLKNQINFLNRWTFPSKHLIFLKSLKEPFGGNCVKNF